MLSKTILGLGERVILCIPFCVSLLQHNFATSTSSCVSQEATSWPPFFAGDDKQGSPDPYNISREYLNQTDRDALFGKL